MNDYIKTRLMNLVISVFFIFLILTLYADYSQFNWELIITLLLYLVVIFISSITIYTLGYNSKYQSPLLKTHYALIPILIVVVFIDSLIIGASFLTGNRLEGLLFFIIPITINILALETVLEAEDFSWDKKIEVFFSFIREQLDNDTKGIYSKVENKVLVVIKVIFPFLSIGLLIISIGYLIFNALTS